MSTDSGLSRTGDGDQESDMQDPPFSQEQHAWLEDFFKCQSGSLPAGPTSVATSSTAAGRGEQPLSVTLCS